MFRFFFDSAWGGVFWIEKLCFVWFRKGGVEFVFKYIQMDTYD